MGQGGRAAGGTGFPPGQDHTCRHGETSKLIVRARNVYKMVVKLSYLYPFCEHSRTVKDCEEEAIPTTRCP